jgi:hypothetical protein
VLVYTVTPDRERVAVATIKDLYVPDTRELEGAVAVMRRNGWLREMEDDLGHLGIPAAAIVGPATYLINVRFEPSQVGAACTLLIAQYHLTSALLVDPFS